MPGRPPRVTKTEAIVLRHRRFVEGARIVTLLTPGRGKLDAVARGVLRPRSKLAGHLEPLRRVEIVLAHGRNLDIVTQAQTVEAFAALHDDLERLSTAIYLADLTDHLTVDHHPSGTDGRSIFDLLHASLVRLARGDGVHLVSRSFEMELLDITGFRPEWDACVSCGAGVEADSVAWSAAGGGVVCPSCSSTDPDASPVAPTVLKVLKAIQRGPYDEAARVRLSPELAGDLERVMHDIVRAVADRELKSQQFVAAARRVTLATDEAGESDAHRDGVYTANSQTRS